MTWAPVPDPAEQDAAVSGGTGTPEPAEAEATGHPAVDAALRGIVQAADDPPAEQVPAYQAAHRTLQEILTSIDEG